MFTLEMGALEMVLEGVLWLKVSVPAGCKSGKHR